MYSVVCSTKDKPGKDLNIQHVIPQEKATYTIVSTIFHYIQILFEYQYTVLYNKGKGAQIL
jgi:hypothetical protein